MGGGEWDCCVIVVGLLWHCCGVGMRRRRDAGQAQGTMRRQKLFMKGSIDLIAWRWCLQPRVLQSGEGACSLCITDIITLPLNNTHAHSSKPEGCVHWRDAWQEQDVIEGTESLRRLAAGVWKMHRGRPWAATWIAAELERPSGRRREEAVSSWSGFHACAGYASLPKFWWKKKKLKIRECEFFFCVWSVCGSTVVGNTCFCCKMTFFN